MKESVISFLLLLAVEAIAAVVNYLKNKLINHLHRNPEFA